MALIRFLSPTSPQLEIEGVPVVFYDGVADIDDADPDRLDRMRFLGQPYGVIELGARQRTDLDPMLDEIDVVIANLLLDETSAARAAMDLRYEAVIPRAGASAGLVPVFQADGTLLPGEGDASGGAVTSVNGQTGAVNLGAADVGARSESWTPSVDDLPGGVVMYSRKTDGEWGPRPTARADIMVIRQGAEPPPPVVASGTDGMLDGDEHHVTP